MDNASTSFSWSTVWWLGMTRCALLNLYVWIYQPVSGSRFPGMGKWLVWFVANGDVIEMGRELGGGNLI